MDEFIKELQKEADISTCSPEVQKGIRWLEKHIRFDEDRSKEELANVANILKYRIKERLKNNYLLGDAKVFYILNSVNSELVNEYRKATEKWDKEEWHYDNKFHMWWFLSRRGLIDNRSFRQIMEKVVPQCQTREGQIFSSESHAECVRGLSAIKPKSHIVRDGIKFLIEGGYMRNIGDTAISVLILSEVDSERYKKEIINGVEYLKNKQEDDGSWNDSIRDTSYSLQAICSLYDNDNENIQRAVAWLKKKQNKKKGYFEEEKFNFDGECDVIINGELLTLDKTADALLALMAAGEGPKISLDRAESEFRKFKQVSETTKPLFVHTSPMFQGEQITEIKTRIGEMISRAKKEVRISSLRVDDLYGEIQNAKKQKPRLDVKILLKKGKIGGERKKISGSAIEILKDVTNGNVLFSDILHSRIVIIDNDEVLVSSADLDHTQLNDEFNAGIWTQDKETVQKAIEFFDNIWDYSTKEKQEQEDKKN